MREVARRQAGGARDLFAAQVGGEPLLHELEGAGEQHRVRVPGVDLDGVDQLLEHLAEPRGERLLIGDAGQRSQRLVVQPKDDGGIAAGLYGGAGHHDDQFEGEAFQEIGVLAASGIDGDEHAVDDAPRLGAFAPADGRKKCGLLVQVGAPDVVMESILQLMDGLGPVALAQGGLPAGGQQRGVSEVVFGREFEQVLAGAKDPAIEAAGVAGTGEVHARHHEATAEALVAHHWHGPDRAPATTAGDARLPPAQRLRHGHESKGPACLAPRALRHAALAVQETALRIDRRQRKVCEAAMFGGEFFEGGGVKQPGKDGGRVAAAGLHFSPWKRGRRTHGG